MSFLVILAHPDRPAALLRDNHGKVRTFTTLAKANRAAKRAVERSPQTRAKAAHKDTVNMRSFK